MKKINYKKQRGVTIIALTVTIIVLLILAGISISLLTDDSELIGKSQESKIETEIMQYQEKLEILKQLESVNNYTVDVNKFLTNYVEVVKQDAMFKENKGITINNEKKTVKVITKEGYEFEVTMDDVIYVGDKGESGNESLPSTEDTKPFLPDEAEVIEDDLSKGVVIKDSNGNEWTWIEVPKSIYTNTKYNGGTAPTSSTDYAKIESTMQNYAKDYRKDGYTDEWHSEEQHGFANAEEYNNHKNAMLKSVYENGGFYIGKYEVGTETLRTSKDAVLTTPVIKEGVYPYNWVTNKQAQEKSKELATGGRTSSLMFGIQWDLVLKHIENKQGKTQAELKDDSTTWGNYYNETFEITKGKYSIDYGETFTEINGTYTKPTDVNVLLTTGATERNNVLNIYDLAGNEWEWTLEKGTIINKPSVDRGGYYGNQDAYHSAFYRGNNNVYESYNSTAFRPAIW